MSIKQNGGVFGRNPTFNDVTIEGDLIINGEVFTGLDFQGSWNASTNTPALASSTGTNGEFYIVSVAGTTDLNGITNWGIGDWAIFNGTVWQRVEGGADGNFNDLTVAGSLSLGDNVKANFGASDDLQIYHDGANSYIREDGVGSLRIQGADLELSNPSEIKWLKGYDNNRVELFFNNSKKLETTATGIDVTGVITTDGMTTSGNVDFGDSDVARFGAGNDLQIYHDGANSYIEEAGTGSLFIRGTNLILEDAGGNDYIAMTDTGTGGTVEIKHNAVTKLATTATGIDVTGTATMDGLTVTDASSSLLSLMEDANSGADVEYDGSSNNFVISTGTGGSGSQAPRLTIQRDSGDISFYEDTGTTAKFFWDASAESLGIGTDSPHGLTHWESTTGTVNLIATNDAADLQADTTVMSLIGQARAENNDLPKLASIDFRTDPTTWYKGNITFNVANSDGTNPALTPLEAMRIDSVGNLLVASTSAANSTAGFRAYSGGNGAFTSSATSLSLNRLSSDGEILAFQKDTATVGSIGTAGGDLNIGTGDTGLQFWDGGDSIYAFNTSTNSGRDAAVDLGSSGVRFKDLYLSGDANVGGLTVDGGSLGNTGITNCDVQITRNRSSNIGLRTVSVMVKSCGLSIQLQMSEV